MAGKINYNDAINGNKLIAYFMAIKNEDGSIYTSVGYPHGTLHFNFKDSPINYVLHPLDDPSMGYGGGWSYRWDYIMPVVNHIQSMGYGFHISPHSVEIIDYTTGNEEEIVSFINDDSYEMFDMYYHSVVLFIEWFNSKKK